MGSWSMCSELPSTMFFQVRALRRDCSNSKVDNGIAATFHHVSEDKTAEGASYEEPGDSLKFFLALGKLSKEKLPAISQSCNRNYAFPRLMIFVVKSHPMVGLSLTERKITLPNSCQIASSNTNSRMTFSPH